MYPFKIVKYNPKKSAPECPFECGGGGAKAKRAMPECPQHEFEEGFPKGSEALTEWKTRRKKVAEHNGYPQTDF